MEKVACPDCNFGQVEYVYEPEEYNKFSFAIGEYVDCSYCNGTGLIEID